MRPTDRDGSVAARVLALSRRIALREKRSLFIGFCHAVALFSEEMEIEAAPFDLTLRESHGFIVSLSPLRELFIVSLGEDRSFDVRVSSVESFVGALDLVLTHYLATRAKTSSAA